MAINTTTNTTKTSATSPASTSESEKHLEESIRPNGLNEIIGRKREKQNLKIMIESALKRGKALDHVLFHGPPGLGKTSMSMVLAKELGVPMFVTTGPAIGKAGDLASILTGLEEKSILFIDEIHRIRPSIEEILYPAMEDNVIDIVLGKGPSAKTIRLSLPNFTIIAATTKLSMLSAPLRDRFGVDFRLDFYNHDELAQIVLQKASKLKVKIQPEAAAEIASRSRMTARIAVRILKRVRDLAVVKGVTDIDVHLVEEILEMLEIDSLGLDSTDRQILDSLHNKFSGKPVGLSTLAASISEDTSTVEEVYEPFLLRIGLLERTARGRVLTSTAINHMIENGY